MQTWPSSECRTLSDSLSDRMTWSHSAHIPSPAYQWWCITEHIHCKQHTMLEAVVHALNYVYRAPNRNFYDCNAKSTKFTSRTTPAVSALILLSASCFNSSGT